MGFKKRENAKGYYASDMLKKLKPAINEINEKTELYIIFQYNDKNQNMCIP